MKRVKVDPEQLSKLVNCWPQYDVLLPLSEKDGERDEIKLKNKTLNTFSIITSVDFYYQASPRKLQVYTHESEPGPAIDVTWNHKSRRPMVEVLLDSDAEVPPR